MSDAAPTDRPPRHFWRRVGALLIDCLIYGVLFYAIAVMFGDLLSTTLGDCESVTARADFQRLYAGTLEEKGLQGYEAQLCISGPTPQLIILFLLETDQSLWPPQPILIPVGADLTPALPPVSPVLSGIIAYALVAVVLIRFGGTPGKLLCGLRVVDRRSGAYPNLRQALIRSVFLYGFSLVSAAVLFGRLSLIASQPPSEVLDTYLSQSFVNLDLAMSIILAAVMIWILVTLIRWNGAILYDRWAGTRVVRAQDRTALSD